MRLRHRALVAAAVITVAVVVCPAYWASGARAATPLTEDPRLAARAQAAIQAGRPVPLRELVHGDWDTASVFPDPSDRAGVEAIVGARIAMPEVHDTGSGLLILAKDRVVARAIVLRPWPFGDDGGTHLRAHATAGPEPSPPTWLRVTPHPREWVSPPVPAAAARDVRAYATRPCEVFTVAQLQEFGFDQPPDSTQTLPSGHHSCVWYDSRHRGRLSVSTYPNWDVLERTWRLRPVLPSFREVQVHGLPTAMHHAADSTCELTIGLARYQGLDVGFTDVHQPYEDPCRAALQAADVAVGNLPPLR
ncbi:MAG: DUF3558 domain-containing protein [Pseudonocardiaceae bacterium]